MDSNEYFFSPNVILKYKLKGVLNEDTIDRFIEIEKNMPPPNYKIKNHNIANKNKWFRKKFTSNSEKTKKKINGYLNKFTDKNYIEITDKILKLKIDSLELLTYLTSNFFEKTITENYYINYWSYLMEKITFNNEKWQFENSTFLLIIYDKLQKYFEKVIDNNYDNYMSELKQNDIKDYYRERKRNSGFAMILSRLYKLNLINIKLLDECLGEFIINSESIYCINISVNILQELCNLFDDERRKLYNTTLKRLLGNININKKIKFVLLDYFENKRNNKQTTSSESEVDIETKIRSCMDEYLTNKNYKDVKYYLNELKAYKNKQYIIYEIFKYSINKQSEDKEFILEVLLKLLKQNVLNSKYVYQSIVLLFNEYNDLLLDYPNIKNAVKLLLKKLKNNKFINRYAYSKLMKENNFKNDFFNCVFS